MSDDKKNNNDKKQVLNSFAIGIGISLVVAVYYLVTYGFDF